MDFPPTTLRALVVERVEIVERGPGSGLSNTPQTIPVIDKIKLIDLLSRARLRRIEVAGFDRPDNVTHMADSAKVLSGIERYPQVSYTASVPNLAGLDCARAAKADEIGIGVSASDGFSRKLLGCSIWESLEGFETLVDRAKVDNIPVRGHISCVSECPIDGPTPPDMVALVAKSLIAMGCTQVCLDDTFGAARPEAISVLLREVQHAVPVTQLACSFQDTMGYALGNIEVALAQGVRSFDASIGGLGRSPFTPGAPGYVATEALDAWLRAQAFDTQLRRDALDEAADFARNLPTG